jgi:hypothetical protein
MMPELWRQDEEQKVIRLRNSRKERQSLVDSARSFNVSSLLRLKGPLRQKFGLLPDYFHNVPFLGRLFKYSR